MNESSALRLENLERELADTKAELGRMKRRYLYWLGSVILAAGLLVLTLAYADAGRQAQARGAPAVHREDRAKRFVLVDDKGSPRAILGMNKDGPGLAFLDGNGSVWASLGLTEVGPVLALLGGTGNTRAVLRVTREGPGLALLDENGRGKVLAPEEVPQ